MIAITVTPPANISNIIGQLQRLPNGLTRAAKNAIGRTVRGSKQDARQKTSERYITGGRIVSPTLKTRVNGLSGSLSSSGARNPLEKFKINPRKRINPAPAGGVYASVVKGQGGNIRRAFIQNSGGVYERVGKARFPIRRFKSVAAPQMVGYRPISQFIMKKMEQRFEKNFAHAAEAIIGGYL